MGGFEPVAKPWRLGGFPPDFAFSLLPEDWEHFRVLMEQACVRIPSLETAPVRRHVNGPESFTPDGRYMLGEARVTVTDVTSAFTVLGIMGPRSRDLLSRLTDADLSNGAFPLRTSHEIEVGCATVRATRIVYVGELGWELSGAYGHTLGRSVGLGYVAHADGIDAPFVRSGRWALEIATERFPATAQLEPPYDPLSTRVRR